MQIDELPSYRRSQNHRLIRARQRGVVGEDTAITYRTIMCVYARGNHQQVIATHK